MVEVEEGGVEGVEVVGAGDGGFWVFGVVLLVRLPVGWEKEGVPAELGAARRAWTPAAVSLTHVS